MSFHVPERYRVTVNTCRTRGWPLHFGTDETIGNYGMFLLPAVVPGRPLKAIASEGEGWEHVSVSIVSKRTLVPTWAEMCAVKDLFWDPEDAVMQLHPRRSDYVNVHEGCLHLWRPNVEGVEIPLPPSVLVGPVTG